MQRAGNYTSLSLGEMLLKARSLFPEGYWFWIGVGALLGYTVLLNILFTLALTYLNRKLYLQKYSFTDCFIHSFLKKIWLCWWLFLYFLKWHETSFFFSVFSPVCNRLVVIIVLCHFQTVAFHRPHFMSYTESVISKFYLL